MLVTCSKCVHTLAQNLSLSPQFPLKSCHHRMDKPGQPAGWKPFPGQGQLGQPAASELQTWGWACPRSGGTHLSQSWQREPAQTHWRMLHACGVILYVIGSASVCLSCSTNRYNPSLTFLILLLLAYNPFSTPPCELFYQIINYIILLFPKALRCFPFPLGIKAKILKFNKASLTDLLPTCCHSRTVCYFPCCLCSHQVGLLTTPQAPKHVSL